MAGKKFEGSDITGSTVRIRKVGDGLEDALKVDGVDLKIGQEVFFIGRGKVRTVAFPPDKKGSERVVREHIVDATDTSLISESQAAPILLKDQERVRRLLEELSGVSHLPGTEG